MARAATRRAPVTVRRGPHPQVTKMRSRIQAGARRAALHARDNRQAITSIGAAALLGFARSRDMQLPTIGNINPALLYGFGLYVAPMLGVRGRIGETLRSAGVGALCVGVEAAVRTGSAVGFDDNPDMEPGI